MTEHHTPQAVENTPRWPEHGEHPSRRHLPPPGLGPVLRDARTRSGLSIRETARRAGISYGYLGMLETGRRCPSLSVADALDAALGLEDTEWAVLDAAALPGVGRDYRRPAPASRTRGAA